MKRNFFLENRIKKVTSKLYHCLHTVMVYNKVIFSYFGFSYENQIILKNFCISNDYIVNSKYKNFQELFDFHKKS